MAKDNQKNTNRGLASASDETRTRVAREGGKASHSGGRRRSWMNSKKEREHHHIQLIILNFIFTLHKQSNIEK